MTSGCALASRWVPNGQRTFRRKAALFCLFRATIPVAASCVWASRTLNHQRTSSALFRRLSVRLPSHSCLGRTTTRYFWWPSFHELRRAMRFVPKAFSGASNRLSTGVQSGQLGAKRSRLRECLLPATETSCMIAGLPGCWHLGILYTVVLRRWAPFHLHPGLHGPSRLGELRVAHGSSYRAGSTVQTLALVWLRYPSYVKVRSTDDMALFARLA